MIPADSLKFPKSARLHHRTLVERLFRSGESLYTFPLRLVWNAETEESFAAAFPHGTPRGIDRVQMMVTVPKKKQRRAVDRVLMRRRIRECYRLMRPRFEEILSQRPDIRLLALSFIFISPDLKSSRKIQTAMASLLAKLQEEFYVKKA